jgi:hypothetical protein
MFGSDFKYIYILSFVRLFSTLELTEPLYDFKQSIKFWLHNCSFVFLKLIDNVSVVLRISEHTSNLLNCNFAFIFDVVIFIFLFLIWLSLLSLFFLIFVITFLFAIFLSLNFISILFVIVLNSNYSLVAFCIQIIDCHKHLSHVQVFALILILGALKFWV